MLRASWGNWDSPKWAKTAQSENYHYHDDIERYDKDLLLQAMKKELDKIRQKEMYEEVDSSTLSQEQLRKVVKTRWVVGDRPDPTTVADTTTGEVHASEIRARFVAKGFSQHISDPLECYAATPSSTSLKGLLLLGILQGHQTTCLDISTAFINTPPVLPVVVVHVVLRPCRCSKPSIRLPPMKVSQFVVCG